MKKSPFVLRKFKLEDVQSLYEALRDKRVVKHMASSGITLEACKTIVAEAIQHWDQYHIGSYAVESIETGKIIGWAGFKFWKENEFELLVVLSPEQWGIGTAVCKELIHQAKEIFSLKKIYILLPLTRKSFSWVQRQGFKFCGDETFEGEMFKKFEKDLW